MNLQLSPPKIIVKNNPAKFQIQRLLQLQMWFIILMLSKLFYLNFWFSRSRLRRGPLIDPKLKNLTSTHDMKKQIREYRQEFQTSNLSETFTDVFKQKKPKLGRRFKIDTVKLNKFLKKTINLRITPQSLTPIGPNQDDLKFLNESKSYLNDQRLQIQFQQKFKKELFMKKQTNRMLKKEDNNFKNFLPQNSNNTHNQYLQAKNKLKNNRIESMMSYKRNNNQLQLLIQSGFIDQPDNLKIIVQKMGQNYRPLISDAAAMDTPSQSTQLSVFQTAGHNSQLTDNPLKSQLLSNITGPEQTRDFQKIQAFLQLYKESDTQTKKKSQQSVDLLLKVKQYQRNLFLSRYQMINYRFKGRVDFTYFKEPQMLSYLKTEKISPVQLLLVFEQNKDILNKFNLPIITPAVMSRIYSKTSTYVFSQTDQNNRVNMLNDPIFRRLQSALFRELDKVKDQHFCDTAWAYACNHELEEGLLNLKKSDAIQRAIFGQLKERIGRLSEEDLGLILRSIIKLNLFNNQGYTEKWEEITQVLKSRLPLIKSGYEYESTLQFLSLLPITNQIISIIVQNVGYFKKYEWQEKSTLLTFSRVCAALLKSHYLIDAFVKNKTFIILKQTLALKAQQTKTIISSLTINQISRVLVVFQQLNKMPFGPPIPKIIINVVKKEIVSIIQGQKNKIYHYTLPTLVTTLSNYDYYDNVIKKQQIYIEKQKLLTPYNSISILKMLTLRQLLPERVFTYNSKLYFVYHQIARLLQTEQANLSIKALADSLFGLSLVQYKNEGLVDTLAFKILEKTELAQKERNSQHITLLQTIYLIKVVNAYSLQKRVTDTLEEICNKVLTQGKQHFKQAHLNLIVSFFVSYVNLFAMPTEGPKPQPQNNQSNQESFSQKQIEQLNKIKAEAKSRWIMNKNFIVCFLYSYKHFISPFLSKLQIQELISLYIVHTMILNNINRIVLTNPNLKSDFDMFNTKCKTMMGELLQFICKLEKQDLKADYRFILSLCWQLNSFDTGISEKTVKFGQFQSLQKQFYQRNIENILKHQEHVGVNLSYTQIYGQLYKKLLRKDSQLSKKAWRIQDINSETVYFCATFDHLMAKYYHEQTILGLFGFWRMYLQIYKRKNWKTQLVCTMLQK